MAYVDRKYLAQQSEDFKSRYSIYQPPTTFLIIGANKSNKLSINSSLFFSSLKLLLFVKCGNSQNDGFDHLIDDLSKLDEIEEADYENKWVTNR